MSRIKSKHTKPELILKKKLKEFQYHPRDVFGNPDFINWRKKTVLFIDGCFWHGCPLHYNKPKSRRSYWIPKIERNMARDKEVDIAYSDAGWKAIRIWEHELK
jgi:DNA mismatch endonuclease (patch repair protein)